MNNVTRKQAFRNNRSYIPLFVSGRPKPVAWLDGRVLRKQIQPNHLLNRPRAIAFDAALLAEAEAQGATTLRVECGRDRFEASLVTFRAHAFAVNRGFGAQLALELGWWSVNGSEAVLSVRERVHAMRSHAPSLFDQFDDEGGAA